MRFPFAYFVFAQVIGLLGFVLEFRSLELIGDVGVVVILLSYFLPKTSFQRYYFNKYFK